uniref:Uncharacterized protein n=1 Tax=Hucho hucho TaxID=62062 RepID=A0A4W5PPX5_9TELE
MSEHNHLSGVHLEVPTAHGCDNHFHELLPGCLDFRSESGSELCGNDNYKGGRYVAHVLHSFIQSSTHDLAVSSNFGVAHDCCGSGHISERAEITLSPGVDDQDSVIARTPKYCSPPTGDGAYDWLWQRLVLAK